MDDPKYFFQKYSEVEFRIKQLDPNFDLNTCIILREKILARMDQRRKVIESQLNRGNVFPAMQEYFYIVDTLSEYDSGGFNTLTYTFCKDERTRKISRTLHQEAIKLEKNLRFYKDWN